MKRPLFSLITVTCLLFFAQPIRATTLFYTDSGGVENRWPGNSVTYTLDFSPFVDSTYHATFSITNTSKTSPKWYAGWFLFKFDGSDGAPISNLVPSTGWMIFNGEPVEVLGGGGNYTELQPGEGGFTGFYVTSLAEGDPADDITQGILLTGDPTSFTFEFDFTIASDSQVNLESMPFKVGYYSYNGIADVPDGEAEAIKVNQLSENLAVPEPATIFLLGSGLIGVAVFVRRKFKR